MNHKRKFGKPVNNMVNGSNADLTPSSPASFPVVLDDFVCDVTSNLSGKWFQAYSACQDSANGLGRKLPVYVYNQMKICDALTRLKIARYFYPFHWSTN